MPNRSQSVPDNVPVLMPLHGNADRRPRPLDRAVTTLGRARGCDLCLEATDVSTLHCLLFRTADGFRIRDCNSRTGTRVNGTLVQISALHDGDVLHIGPFSFELKLPHTPPSSGLRRLDARKVRHWQDSRRRLAEHALRLRRRLHELGRAPLGAAEAELRSEADQLHKQAQEYASRLSELEEAERALDREREAFRARVQEIEGELAGRLDEVEQQVRARWQEFQQRCKAEEVQLRERVHAQLAGASPSPQASADGTAAPVDRERLLAAQAEALRRERKEFDGMRQHFETGQANARASLEQREAALAQQETALRRQRGEIGRMIGDLRQLQEDLRRQQKPDVRGLTEENERLRRAVAELERRAAQHAEPGPELEVARAENELLHQLLKERESRLEELEQQCAAAAAVASADEAESLRADNARLKHRLAENDEIMEELRDRAAPRPPKAASELERYEAELNEYRKQLEADRAKLTAEIERARGRNQELDEATRDMEIEFSRERAEIARERIRMERMREEIKADMEKMQRELSMRESLAPVQRLRDEIAQKKVGGRPGDASDRGRTVRNGGDTPRP
jgi:chromosome segregation ATPase